MGSCQNYGPFLGTLNNRCRIIIRTQKGTIILTTTHIRFRPPVYMLFVPRDVMRNSTAWDYTLPHPQSMLGLRVCQGTVLPRPSKIL